MLADDFTETFIRNVLLTAKRYIEVGFWQGIERSKFERWCTQFKTSEERVLLAFLVESIVYRSNAQTAALIDHAIYKIIPQSLYQATNDETHFTSIRSILSSKTKDINYGIVPVIRDIDPPTKSGPLVARLYKRLGGVNEKLMFWPWTVPENARLDYVIFVDDFVGSGNQFLRFIDKHISEKVIDEETRCVYAPLTASTEGLKKIAEERPDIHLAPIEVISSSDSFFNYISRKYKFTDDENSEISEIYDSFLKKVKLHKIGGNNPNYNMARGYKGLAMTYAYQHATPNASLPLLWANNDHYTSLFLR